MPKHKIMILVMSLLFTSAAYASAHSAILSSTPKDDSVVSSRIETVKVTFNTKIEKIIKISAKNEAGEINEPDSFSIDNKTLTARFSPLLEKGSYLVQITLIGADGHKIETAFSFAIEPANDDYVSANQPSQSQISSPSIQAEVDNSRPKSGPILWGIATIAVAALILVFVSRRRSK